MRKRLLIVVGVIALAGVLALVIPDKAGPRIFARSLWWGTNAAGTAYQFVVLSNCTDLSHTVQVWSEYKMPGGQWSRESTNLVQKALGPHAIKSFGILMPTRGKHRITVIYEYQNTRLHYWLRQARTLLGIKPFEGNQLHVEVE